MLFYVAVYPGNWHFTSGNQFAWQALTAGSELGDEDAMVTHSFFSDDTVNAPPKTSLSFTSVLNIHKSVLISKICENR